MENKNYYERLGVEPSATYDEIREKFLQLIAKYHPDLNSENKDYYTKISQFLVEAYECLKNEKLRKEYDKILGTSHNVTPRVTHKLTGDTTSNNPNPTSTTSSNKTVDVDAIIRDFLSNYPFNVGNSILEHFRHFSNPKYNNNTEIISHMNNIATDFRDRGNIKKF